MCRPGARSECVLGNVGPVGQYVAVSGEGRPVSTPTLDTERAATYLKAAIENIDRRYPYYPAHLLTDPDDRRHPADLHPAFHGSFDWHSCVHMHWSLLRLLRLHPEAAGADEARSIVLRNLTEKRLAGEVAYLEEPGRAGFERPYGWAWVLALSREAGLWDAPEASAVSAALQPLATLISTRFVDWISRLRHPIRSGMHADTGFAMILALRAARAMGDVALVTAVENAALRWYAHDVDAPTGYEPSGEDFLSPTLTEAHLLSLVLPSDRFLVWLDGFLPGLATGEVGPVGRPVDVGDESDYRMVHLHGLNLSRAWSWRSLARAIAGDHGQRSVAERVATEHVAASLPYVVTGGYGGDHWLATFAVLALDGL